MTPGRRAMTGICALVICAAALAAAPAGVAPRCGADDDDGRRLAAIWAILDESGGAPAARPVRELEALGPEAIPALCQAYRGLRPRKKGAPSVPPPDPKVVARCRTIVAAALRALPESDLHDHLRALAGAGGRLGECVQVIQIIAATGRRGAIPLMIEVGEGIAPELVVLPHVGRSWSDALTAILRRDSGAFTELGRAWEKLGAFAPATIRAVERLPEARSLMLLGMRLGLLAEQDAQILGAMTTLVEASPFRITGDLLDRVREALDSEHADVRRGAARLAAASHDTDALPRLIGGLSDPDATVRRASQLALAAISGRRGSAAPDAWRIWYGREQRWLTHTWPDLVEQLGSANEAVVLRAVRETFPHRVWRDAIIPELSALAASPNETVRATALEALGNLGDKASLPVLLAGLRDEGPAVLAAAHRALRTLTGRDLPAEAEAWEEALAHLLR